MGWLKEEAPASINPMFVTRLVFQFPMVWLNAPARSNMCLMSTTWLVFQFPMGSLKEPASLNKKLMFVTRLVSHCEIASLPAAPQSTDALEQSQLPVGLAAIQLSTAALSAVAFANGAALAVVAHAQVTVTAITRMWRRPVGVRTAPGPVIV